MQKNIELFLVIITAKYTKNIIDKRLSICYHFYAMNKKKGENVEDYEQSNSSNEKYW